LDYYTSGGTAGCPALLVEPSAQNIMAQSETLSVSGNWTQTNVNVSGGAIASPDGLASGTLLVATSGSAEHNISRSAATTVASGAVVTTSCFFKAHGTNNFAQLIVGGFAFSPSNSFANFNLSGNGAITTGTYSSAFIENYGNGWYRCGFTATAAASGTPGCIIRPILASGTARNPNFAGDGVNGVYAWGVQVETGSVATSYIPTTAAAVTRSADVINLSGAVSGCIGQTEGTIYAEVDVRSFTDGNRIVCLSDGTSDNRIILQEGANSTLQAIVTNATSGVVDISTASGRTAGIYKIAIGYKQDDFAVYVNGSQTGTENTGGVPACNQIFIGKIETTATTNQFNDRIRSAALYTTRLTDSELAALTT
jgi:hypothetical protein